MEDWTVKEDNNMAESKYVYQILTDDEKDEITVAFMEAQERDKFCHELNMERYDDILTSLPEGDFRKKITNLRTETQSRLDEVNPIIVSTQKQMPDAARVTAAQARLKAKQEG